MICREHPPVRQTLILAVLTASTISCGSTLPQETSSTTSDDPAPPTVTALEPAASPGATPFAELRFHRPPEPLAAGAVTQDWPCFLGPDRNGHSRETKLLKSFPEEGLTLVWEMRTGLGYAAPAIVGDRLVFTHREGNEAHIDCLNTETGQRYWRFSYPCEYRARYISNNGPRSSPSIEGDRVYVHGVEGMLHCLDLQTGRVVWKRDIAAEFQVPDHFFGVVASPMVYRDLLIQNIGAPGGPSVAAFDLATGKLVWGSGDEWGPSCASPVVAQSHGRERLFVMGGGESRPPTGGLMVMDPLTGTMDFTHPFRSRTYESVNGASPVVGDERVFLTSSYGVGTAGLALEPDGSYEELWSTRRIGLQFANPIYQEGHVYVVDGQADRLGAMVCLDPQTGEELSRTDLGWDETVFYRGEERPLPMSVGEGSLLLVDGDFLCLGDNGHLLWLRSSPEGTEVLARTSLFRANQTWTQPVVSRGLLYVCQNIEERFGREPAPPRLMCFDLRAP
jgi:outer membrane protein assembly factor BamB